jgi:hypothetical protein
MCPLASTVTLGGAGCQGKTRGGLKGGTRERGGGERWRGRGREGRRERETRIHDICISTHRYSLVLSLHTHKLCLYTLSLSRAHTRTLYTLYESKYIHQDEQSEFCTGRKTNIHIHIHVRTCTCTCTYTRTYTCTYTCTHTYICRHTHERKRERERERGTHTHTNTHTMTVSHGGEDTTECSWA